MGTPPPETRSPASLRASRSSIGTHSGQACERRGRNRLETRALAMVFPKVSLRDHPWDHRDSRGLHSVSIPTRSRPCRRNRMASRPAVNRRLRVPCRYGRTLRYCIYLDPKCRPRETGARRARRRTPHGRWCLPSTPMWGVDCINPAYSKSSRASKFSRSRELGAFSGVAGARSAGVLSQPRRYNVSLRSVKAISGWNSKRIAGK